MFNPQFIAQVETVEIKVRNSGDSLLNSNSGDGLLFFHAQPLTTLSAQLHSSCSV